MSEVEKNLDAALNGHNDQNNPNNSTNSAAVTPELIPVNTNEYAIDTSDEEDLRNTIGNVPLKWYDDYEHIGYDLDGKK